MARVAAVLRLAMDSMFLDVDFVLAKFYNSQKDACQVGQGGFAVKNTTRWKVEINEALNP